MNLGLDLSQKLQIKLSYQMIQSLKLLQVNTLQLEQLLKTELEMNPVLEISEDQEEQEELIESEPEKESEKEDELQVEEDTIDWEEYLEEGFDLGYSYNEEIDPNKEYFEPVPVHQISLEEYLNNQISEKKLPEKTKLILQFLIGCLENDGYLRISLDQIATFIKIPVHEIEETLSILWHLEPPGLGARNLQECLIIQLQHNGMGDSIAYRILKEKWDLFEKLKIPEIATTFSIDTKEVQKAIDIIKKLHPKPAYLINPERSSAIYPDLLVEKVEGKFVVIINDRSVPSLHISKRYVDLLKRGNSTRKEVKNFIREKFNNATWLIRSIEQRKATMIKVMYAIIEKQPEFFEKGPPNLNPLKLQDVADIISMHISTVSRVTSNKYVQTPHGIFELKYFFSDGLGQDTSGTDISTVKIKNRIKELIGSENRKKPLSDQKITELLKKEGMMVARRTIAKYREQLKILPARMRQIYD